MLEVLLKLSWANCLQDNVIFTVQIWVWYYPSHRHITLRCRQSRLNRLSGCRVMCGSSPGGSSSSCPSSETWVCPVRFDELQDTHYSGKIKDKLGTHSVILNFINLSIYQSQVTTVRLQHQSVQNLRCKYTLKENDSEITDEFIHWRRTFSFDLLHCVCFHIYRVVSTSACGELLTQGLVWEQCKLPPVFWAVALWSCCLPCDLTGGASLVSTEASSAPPSSP